MSLDDILTVIAQYRARREDRIAHAVLETFYPNSTPFTDFADLVVIECPRCRQRVGFEIDFSEGQPAQATTTCDQCNAVIRISLTYGLPPVEKVTVDDVRPTSLTDLDLGWESE